MGEVIDLREHERTDNGADTASQAAPDAIDRAEHEESQRGHATDDAAEEASQPEPDVIDDIASEATKPETFAMEDTAQEASQPGPATSDDTLAGPPQQDEPAAVGEAAVTDHEPELTLPDEVPSLGAPSLAAALEALLLLADEPMPSATLAQVTGVPQLEVEAALAELAMTYLAEGRGIELRRVDTGWRYYTAESCRELVTRYVTDGRQARLSQAALETLAIVAYRQPVTRAQVGAVRGVNSDGVLKTLAARGLIAQSTDADEAAAHFVTTPYFLDRMGIASLSELPPIAAHLPDLSSLDELVE